MNAEAAAQPTVLVVDHFPGNQRLYEVLLRRVAGQVLIAATPTQALALLDRHHVDVALIEPQGANLLEWDLLEALQQRDIPTLVVTSRVDDWILDEAALRGATLVLTKPFQGEDLCDAVTALANFSHKDPADGTFGADGESMIPPGSTTEGEHHAPDARRLGHRLDEPSVTESRPVESVAFQPLRLQRASFAWSVVAAIAFIAALSFGSAVPFLPWFILTAIATGLAVWTVFNADRSTYNASLSVQVALGVAVGPLAAPLALTTQGIVSSLAKGVWTRAHWRTTTMNIGVSALDGFALGVGLRFVIPTADLTTLGWAWLALGVMGATTVALAVNYTSVRASLRYLTGKASPLPMHWYRHLRDVVAGTLLAILVFSIGEALWVVNVAAVLGAGLVISWQLREVRRAQLAAYGTLQGQIAQHEQEHAVLRDHTQQVVMLVEQLTGNRPQREQTRAAAAAWCHSLTTGGWPDRCAGADKPDLWDQVRHLPHSWELADALEAISRPSYMPLGELDDLDIPSLVGLACTIDALRLETGQLRSTYDIRAARGYPMEAIQTAYGLRHG